MKNTLPIAWKMDTRVQAQMNDDDSIQFFFNMEYHLITVLEEGPWTFKEWMVVVDKWTNRHKSDYLWTVSFWVRIFNLPNERRNVQTIKDIEDSLGAAVDINIRELNRDAPAEVWVKMDINTKHIFNRYVELEEGEEPVLIRFEYDKLKKFCRRSDFLTHDNTTC